MPTPSLSRSLPVAGGRIWTGLIAVLAILALGSAIVLRRPKTESPQTRPPPKRPSSAPSVAPPGSINLLDLVHLPEDAVNGSWTFEERSLKSPPIPYARLQFPCALTPNYDLHLEVRRALGENSLNVGLPVGDHQILCVLDGGKCSGLEFVDGKPFNENATKAPGTFLKNSGATSIDFEVRPDRVSVLVDKKAIIQWPADYAKSYLQENWTVPRKDTLFIGSWSSTFLIDEAILISKDGALRPLR